MANYLELNNENNKVVIDSQLFSPCLMFKGSGVTDVEKWTSNMVYYAFYPWKKVISLGSGTDFDAIGIDPKKVPFPLRAGKYDPASAEFRLAGEMGAWLASRFIVVCRTDNENVGAYATLHGYVNVSRVGADNVTSVELELELNSGFNGTKVEYAVYCIDPTILIKTSNGFQAYNEAGDVVFDALKPPLIVIGTMMGDANVWQDLGATFEYDIPPGLDYKSVFITARSGTPYYAAFNISNNVSYAHTNYEPRMDFPNGNKVRVRLVRQKQVPGTNSADLYNGYYENVVYCPFPDGNYAVNNTPR